MDEMDSVYQAGVYVGKELFEIILIVGCCAGVFTLICSLCTKDTQSENKEQDS